MLKINTSTGGLKARPTFVVAKKPAESEIDHITYEGGDAKRPKSVLIVLLYFFTHIFAVSTSLCGQDAVILRS